MKIIHTAAIILFSWATTANAGVAKPPGAVAYKSFQKNGVQCYRLQNGWTYKVRVNNRTVYLIEVCATSKTKLRARNFIKR